MIVPGINADIVHAAGIIAPFNSTDVNQDNALGDRGTAGWSNKKAANRAPNLDANLNTTTEVAANNDGTVEVRSPTAATAPNRDDTVSYSPSGTDNWSSEIDGSTENITITSDVACDYETWSRSWWKLRHKPDLPVTDRKWLADRQGRASAAWRPHGPDSWPLSRSPTTDRPSPLTCQMARMATVPARWSLQSCPSGKGNLGCPMLSAPLPAASSASARRFNSRG